MSYIKQFETQLREKLESRTDTDSIVRWVSEKVLESYRNGLTAGKKGGAVGHEPSRQHGPFGKAQ
jgi:hypothetical protein